MKVIFSFKGSIFNQKKSLELDLKDKSTIFDALQTLTLNNPDLEQLLFKNNSLRNNFLIIVDRVDVISMNLLDLPLKNGQEIVIIPLAHGGK